LTRWLRSFIYYFNFAQVFNHLKFAGRVYRGANLSSSVVEVYQHTIGGTRSWLGLTSTTRQREIAERFLQSTVPFIVEHELLPVYQRIRMKMKSY
jgi:hypothetical protein